MKTISELAYDAIIPLNLTPAADVGINAVVDADWDGTPRILITESEAEIEECQIGTIAQTAVLTIYCLAADRVTAMAICRQAAEAAFALMESLEGQPEEGILGMMRNTTLCRNIADRNEFEALRTFTVIRNYE
jgi:hypothetical protein